MAYWIVMEGAPGVIKAIGQAAATVARVIVSVDGRASSTERARARFEAWMAEKRAALEKLGS